LVVQAVVEPLQAGGYPLDQLTLAQEPGRYLVAETGVTLYRVGPVKKTPVRTYIAVDGGLSDNPRPAMYEAKYDVELIRQGERAQWDVPVDGPGAVFGSPGLTKVTISGRHCETDELFRDVELPADVQNGDLVQVFTTGAYNSSMASNYNRFTRPATVLLRPDGTADLVQSRETIEQLFEREHMPEDLQ
jgi:diaminopimelate decarboxylase